MTKKKYATVTFNTDGAPLFTSSTYSIWPIYLMLNELPYHVRTNELILAGLWFGQSKPNMNTFLGPFVEKMNILSTEGVSCQVHDSTIQIKIFTLICCVDSVARAPMMGFTLFNGKCACPKCLHPGESVKSNPNNPRSGNMKYPLQSEVPKDRNMKCTIQHMKSAAKFNKTVFGIKGPSHLINLVNFDIIKGVVPDSLHCCTGVAKQFATKWFGNKKKAGLFSKSFVPEIDTCLKNLKVPNQIVRLTRSFSEKEFWKAREWENWILYFSLPSLQNILPPRLLIHWSLFVSAMYLLLKDNIQFSDIDIADKLLRQFVGETEILYSKVSMTFNVHLLLHLTESVYDWGPLWAHNTYAFESQNGKLLKVIHAAKGVHHQVCRRISLQYSMLILKDRIYPDCSYHVKHYFDNIGTSTTQKTARTFSVRYFGSGRCVDKRLIEKFGFSNRVISYIKIVKDSCLYMSCMKTNKRSDNSFAILNDGSYVQLIKFIIDKENYNEFTIVRKIDTENFLQNDACSLRKIVKIHSFESLISTISIHKSCVHMTVSDKTEYLSSLPNLYHY